MQRTIATLLLGFIVYAGSAAGAAHTSTVQPCTPSKPHEVHVLPGFINVHIECERVLLEIPTAMLDRDMLLSTEFAALSTGSSEYAPGTSVNNVVVRWLRRGNRVSPRRRSLKGAAGLNMMRSKEPLKKPSR